MLLVEAENLRKSFKEKLILDIGKLEIYSTDKIGIVGVNGSGKTTLLKLIYGEIPPDVGSIKAYGQISFIRQLVSLEYSEADPRMLSLYGVAADITKKPKHVSYSEYNSKPWESTRTFGSKQKSMNRTVKAIESRITALEVKEKPGAVRGINFFIPDNLKLNSKFAVMGTGITKNYGEKVIFDNAGFNVKTGSKTVIIGNNGAGKTTLMKMILDQAPGIIVSPKARTGYFDQDLSQLNENFSVYDNVMTNSIYNQSQVRSLLAQMLFTGNDLNKKVFVLSGGERIRLLLTRLFVSEFNILLMDEPTNFLDVKSIEVFEATVRDYKGTIVFVSHDERLVENVADSVLLIEHHKIKQIK